MKTQTLLSLKRPLLLKLAILLALAFTTLTLGCPQCYYLPLNDLGFNLLFSLTMCMSLWMGNDLLTTFLDRQILWLQNPVKRLTLSVAGTVVVSVFIVFLVNLTFLTAWGISFREQLRQNWLPIFLFPLIITFIISMFMHGRSFLLGWRQTAIDAERLKGENITSQYESLKNQVNPHFLFNILNTLTSLVHDKPDLAVKFIKQLSEVYRYVLDSQSKEVVPLATELKFVESYVFLQKIRFGDDLHVHIQVPESSSIQIAPLSLQMLLENAVKHNIILEEMPLHIQIYLEDGDYIVVKNNLQEKRTGLISSELGLKNIKARYEYLTNKPVHIAKTVSEYIVKLPVLNFQKI